VVVTGNKKCRIFDMAESAIISSLVIQDGYDNANYQDSLGSFGAGIRIRGTGGVISNCVIRGCNKCGQFDQGGGGIGIAAKATDAIVTHCVFSNCFANGSCYTTIEAGTGYCGGAALMMCAGHVRNCLFMKNERASATGVNGCYHGTVRVVGGTLENCTVTDNSAGNCAGVWADGTGGQIINCIIIGNRCVNAAQLESYPNYPVWAETASAFTNCLADLETKINESCLIGTTNQTFKNFAVGDFRLSKTSPAVNMGIPRDWMTGATDFAGKPRVFGSKPDIGAYECQVGGFVLIVR